MLNYEEIFCKKEGRFCSFIEKETDAMEVACMCPVTHYLVQHELDCNRCKAIKKLKSM